MSKVAHGLPIRAAPYKHQREAAEFALEHLKAGGGAALLMEMGTGKTITSIAIVGQLRNEGLIHRLLVICPVSVMGSDIRFLLLNPQALPQRFPVFGREARDAKMVW